MKHIVRIASITLAMTLMVMAAIPALARQNAFDAVFEAVDLDHNGLVSAEEWHTAMQKRFEEVDRNSDGNISREEAQETKDTIRERFKAFKSAGNKTTFYEQ